LKINVSLTFSRTVGSAPDTSRRKVLSQPHNPISSQSDSRVISC
jgi:hypothetical protein